MLMAMAITLSTPGLYGLQDKDEVDWSIIKPRLFLQVKEDDSDGKFWDKSCSTVQMQRDWKFGTRGAGCDWTDCRGFYIKAIFY
jgi:hypothetical protein